MRRILELAVVLLIIGCTQNRPTADWPAVITSVSGLSDAQKAEFLGYAHDMNTITGSSIIADQPATDSFSIAISVTDPPANEPNRAGYSVHDESTCSIQLSRFLLSDNMKQYRKSVIIHEIGHCKGLVHVSETRQVMSAITYPYSDYTSDAISNFAHSLLTGQN